MRILGFAAGLTLAGAAAAPAQLAIQQPTERLLLLPLVVKTPADSTVSIAVMDAARERLGQLARYKIVVIPKPKLCEALKASDFPCDILPDETQARQLAQFLTVNAYTTGTFERSGATLTARIRVRDIGGSGLAALLLVTNGNPGTPAALGEAIAQRLNTLIRAGEAARECNDQRQKGQFSKALDQARKALAIEPNLTAAELCISTVYEAERLPVDSLIAAALRATKGDSLNATAWDRIASGYQQKGDTLKAIDAFIHELAGEPQNMQLRLGIAELLRQEKQYQRAVSILDAGLAWNPGDQRLIDFKQRLCSEGELWRCELDGFITAVHNDTTKLNDSTLIKAALGAGQQVQDTQALLFFSHAAVKRFPKAADFWKALGAAFDLKGQKDSSLWAYKQAIALDPNDVKGALLIAKGIVDGAVYDTAQANRLKADTAGLHQFRNAYADRVDSARTYLERALAASDSGLRLTADVISLTAGSKLAQAGAYDRAYAWLDRLLQGVAPRTPADTLGPRQQIRVQASFWYGFASLQTLAGPYGTMTRAKSCEQAKAVFDRIQRTREAMELGKRVSPQFVGQLEQNLAKYQEQLPKVRQAFKCRNF
ncbi:MAG TPA: tetratricopeptide repeat protein [Gemmatimonadales bacterium]|nr:tetratricopeptide repeat protein [Gemmatimonadales bacterium]